MKRKTLFTIAFIALFASSYAQMSVPAQTSGSGPLGSSGSLLTFFSGGPPFYTAIQEVWGLNLCGSQNQPIKVYNASLLVGFQSSSEDFGKGNIFANGYVGVGTTDTKGYKFAVNGSAIATSMTVKVNSAWPDYVFKKDYQLPSLQDVKTYIDQNQHLPEVPSEQQIAKDGLNLGEMNKLLLKKVEELTLYLIEKDQKEKKQLKTNDILESKLKQQQAEIDALKAQMKAFLKP